MLRAVDAQPEVQQPTQHEVDVGFTRWLADLAQIAHYTLVVAAGLLFIVPLVWMVGASLRQVGLPPPSTLEWIPERPVLDNYARIFEQPGLPLGSYFANSLKVVLLAVPFTVVTASWAGFAMSQLAPRTRGWLVVVSLAALMVPVTALWLTRFIVYKWIGVLDTLWALLLPSFMGTSPFYVLLFYWAFSRIPGELFEAARLEGANALRVWASVAMPLARPAILTVAALSMVLYWSNYLDPLLYLNNQENYTLPVGIQALHQMHPTAFPLLMAGAVVITLPVLVIFLLAQRYFLHETRGAGWLGN